jgi:hypothetical protein
MSAAQMAMSVPEPSAGQHQFSAYPTSRPVTVAHARGADNGSGRAPSSVRK